MNIIKYQKHVSSLKKCYRQLSTVPNAEYSEVPEYPPIEDLSYEAKKKKNVQSWANSVKNVNTVEEKQMKLNIPKYYGWKSIMFNDLLVPYNAMPLVQHCTRTCFKEKSDALYNRINVDEHIEKIQTLVEEAILFENDTFKNHEIYGKDLSPKEKEDFMADSIVQHINRIILNNLSTVPHLRESQVDIHPRHEAFWFVGGIEPPTNARKSREKFDWSKDLANNPIDRAAQYIGTPSLAIRCKLPLEPFIDLSQAEDSNLDVPKFTFDPRVIGYNSANRHGTNIPGFWPGDSHEFGLLSYQPRGHMLNRSKTYGEKDDQEALHTHAILSSFSWLLSQASYHGFTTYNDLTYPLVTQTIITNGQKYSFYTYQLNTILMHTHNIDTNPRKNICWGTDSQDLYHEINNGKLVGFNPDVLKTLLKFYLNSPKERNIEMKPYLKKSEHIVANIKDDEKREWLEKQYKHMMANRPRSKKSYEIYHWEKIYKIDHPSRIMEARDRPFELGINPWSRKYDERSPSYIPKALRPGGPKSKPKFYKNYYP